MAIFLLENEQSAEMQHHKAFQGIFHVILPGKKAGNPS